MLLFAGLGNPGSQYAGQRHNIGFMVLDALAEAYRFGNWRTKFQAEIAKGEIEGVPVLLLKPQTFMNLSGQSIGEACRFHKIKAKDVFVFHDELDLGPGKVKYKMGGGAAGHNGLRSTQQHIGADFPRIRLGIGHPGAKHLVSPYVLGDFAKSDHTDWLDDLLRFLPQAVPYLAKGDAPRFLTELAILRGASDLKSQKTAKPTQKQNAKPQPKPSNVAAAKPQNDTESQSPFAVLKAKLFSNQGDT